MSCRPVLGDNLVGYGLIRIKQLFLLSVGHPFLKPSMSLLSHKAIHSTLGMESILAPVDLLLGCLPVSAAP